MSEQLTPDELRVSSGIIASMPNRPSTTSNIERFEKKIGDRSHCWTWAGTLHSNGYGLFDVRVATNSWKKVWAHRFAFETFVRPLADKETVDHLCRNIRCVNPSHLDGCSNHENNLRAPNTLAGANIRKIQCPKGHPYSGENLYYDGGKRRCRECTREKNRAARARRSIADQ